MIYAKPSVLFHRMLVLLPLATNNHWFSLAVGPFLLAAISLVDLGPTKMDRRFCIYHLSLKDIYFWDPNEEVTVFVFLSKLIEACKIALKPVIYMAISG